MLDLQKNIHEVRSLARFTEALYQLDFSQLEMRIVCVVHTKISTPLI